MNPTIGKGLRQTQRVSSAREELGLPPLARAKENFRAYLIARLSKAEYPIRNEEELRRALGASLRADELVRLVAPQDYLFTNPRQIADRMTERVAALWDLAARPEHARSRDRRLGRALRARLARREEHAPLH